MQLRSFRRVIFKKKKCTLLSNPKVFLKNTIYFFPKNSCSFIYRKQYEKLVLFLKWFKRYQKKKLGLICNYTLHTFPFFFNTKKALGIRMGKGKGEVFEDFCNLVKGQLFLEVFNISPIFLKGFLKKFFSFFNFTISFYISH